MACHIGGRHDAPPAEIATAAPTKRSAPAKPGPHALRGGRFKDKSVKDCEGKQPHETGLVVELLWANNLSAAIMDRALQWAGCPGVVVRQAARGQGSPARKPSIGWLSAPFTGCKA